MYQVPQIPRRSAVGSILAVVSVVLFDLVVLGLSGLALADLLFSPAATIARQEGYGRAAPAVIKAVALSVSGLLLGGGDLLGCLIRARRPAWRWVHALMVFLVWAIVSAAVSAIGQLHALDALP